MPGFSVVGAGKGTNNASKTISTWKYWYPETWPRASVGGTVVRGRGPAHAGVGTGGRHDFDGRADRAQGDPSPNERREPGAPIVPYTFAQFVKEVYLPHCRRTWKRSTAYTSEHTVKTLWSQCLRPVVDSVTGAKCRICSRRRRKSSQSRWWPTSGGARNPIFKLAVSDGLVRLIQPPEVRIPTRCKDGPTIRSLSEEEVIEFLDALDPRERLIVVSRSSKEFGRERSSPSGGERLTARR